MIDLRDVTKRYDGARVLGPASLHVAAGERLAIVGASGCGKSTLLRMMIGLLLPDEGSVTFDGIPFTKANANALRLRIGYVLQDGGLFPHLTNAENVRLVARLRGWTAARIDARVETLSKMVRLEPARLARFPSQLSGGERQRVGLMRALMLDPDVILLDEPLGALDAIVRASLQGELVELMTRLAKCVVVATHDLREAAVLGQTVAVMEKGRILQRAPMEELIATPADPFVTALLRAGGLAKSAA